MGEVVQFPEQRSLKVLADEALKRNAYPVAEVSAAWQNFLNDAWAYLEIEEIYSPDPDDLIEDLVQDVCDRDMENLVITIAKRP